MDKSSSRPRIFMDNNIFYESKYTLIKKIYMFHLLYICNQNIIPIENNSLLLDIGNSETSILDKLYDNNILNNIIGENIMVEIDIVFIRI